MMSPEESNSHRQEEEWWFPEARGGGNGGLSCNGHRVLIWDDDKVLATVGGAGCTTV